MHHEFPHPDLARELLPHAFDHRDGAHDQAHLLRVWRNAELILAVEGGDTEILPPLAYYTTAFGSTNNRLNAAGRPGLRH